MRSAEKEGARFSGAIPGAPGGPLALFEVSCGELADQLAQRCGCGAYHAAAIYRGVFQRGGTRIEEFPELARSPALARRIAADLRLPACRIVASREMDGVVKFATALGDGQIIESVVIPAAGRTTLCVSSQVGCRMGCRFCATGAMGFGRNLLPAEIVWQVWAACFRLAVRVDNVVFMGMGEPLDNFAHVAQALRVMSDQRGLDIAPRRITVSSAGHADGIRRLGRLGLPNLRLAVSLNAADDRLRSRLMPINQRYPLACLKAALEGFPIGRGGVVLVEYVLLAGINDARGDAAGLAAYLKGLVVRVNVIAYNGDGRSGFAAPPAAHVARFCRWLAEEGVFFCRRQPRGRDILAACGQLGASLAAR
jgi:23S rRNA (adenine2503-C2)-methyltransferase